MTKSSINKGQCYEWHGKQDQSHNAPRSDHWMGISCEGMLPTIRNQKMTQESKGIDPTRDFGGLTPEMVDGPKMVQVLISLHIHTSRVLDCIHSRLKLNSATHLHSHDTESLTS